VKTKEIDLAEFTSLYPLMKGGSVYVSGKYLQSLSSIKKIKLYKIEKGSAIKAIFPVNAGRKLFINSNLQPPFTQYFNILTADAANEEREKLNFNESILGAYCKFLKEKYPLFSIPLHPYFEDMRNFIWSGVKVKPLYTYTVKINKDEMDKVNPKIKRKAGEMELKIKNADLNFKKMFEDIKKAYNGKQPVNENEYEIFMKELEQSDLLDVYESENGMLVLLKDFENKTIYEFNVFGRESGPMIYSAINFPKYNGWTFDFQGANTKSIAKYKSWFSPSLLKYFRISRFL